MCGIAGIFNHNGSISTSEMDKMLGSLRHRGPDDSGMVSFKSASQVLSGFEGEKYSNPGDSDLVLGHLRLSIIDLFSAGHQPGSTNEGDLCQL